MKLKVKNALNAQDFSYLKKTIGQRKCSWFQNVYLYITEKCQLRCGYCYLGERLKRASTMPINQIRDNLIIWKELGGRKICFLGGEPTLHPQFEEAVRYANTLGYEKVIVNTNGLQPALNKLKNFDPSDFSYIQISLDGVSPYTHDKIRGKGTSRIVLNTIKELCKKGFDVRIICTVNRLNIKGCLNILPVADNIGVSLVKYHIFSGIGNGKKNIQWLLNPYEWIEFTETLLKQKGKYETKIQYQPAYAKKETINRYLNEGYEGCLGRKLDRVSIFPDGNVYMCSYLFDTDLNFAKIVNGQIQLNRGFSELNLFSQDECKCCKFNKICLGGCPAEKVVTGLLPCNAYSDVFPICRLWKSTV